MRSNRRAPLSRSSAVRQASVHAAIHAGADPLNARRAGHYGRVRLALGDSAAMAITKAIRYSQVLIGRDSWKRDPLWPDISSAPKDGTKIIGWLVPNEVEAPEKAKPWIIWWEVKQWKDGTGKKVGKPFGMWVNEGWRDPMSYAPTHWVPTPQVTE